MSAKTTNLNVLALDGSSEVVGTPTVTVLTRDPDGMVMLARGATLPSAADAGYGHGCIFMYTAGGAGTTLYINEGSNTSASFAAVGTSSGSIPTWDQIYGADKSLAISSTTLTFDGTHASNDVLTITDSAAGSGDLIQITNTGTGKDINGTSSTWSVSSTGAIQGISLTGTATNTTVTIDANGSGGVTINGTGTGTITLGAAVTVASAKVLTVTGSASGTTALAMTAGDLVMSDGQLNVTRTGDNANAFTVTNNSTTSVSCVVIAGSGTHTGNTTGSFMTLTASGLTTGTVLYMPAAALTTGKVINISATAQTSGTLVTVLGGGSSITSGILADLQMGAATGGNGLKISTTGVYGTGSSGLLNVTANSATDTTGLVQVSGTGITSGSAVLITGSGATMAAGGKALELALGANTAGNGITVTSSGVYTGTGLVLLTAGAMTTGIVLSIVSTTGLTSGSLIRATSSTAGALATNGAISFTATGAFTSTSNVNGGFVEVKANSTTAGTVVNIVSSALTTGVALGISNGTAATTTGSLLLVQAGGTGAVSGNGIVSFLHTGVYTSTAVGFVNINASATTAGTVMSLTSASLTSGIGLKITLAALTTGAAIDTTGIAATKQNFNMNSSTGSTAAPQTNAPTGFFKIGIGGTDQWVPYYSAT